MADGAVLPVPSEGEIVTDPPQRTLPLDPLFGFAESVAELGAKKMDMDFAADVNFRRGVAQAPIRSLMLTSGRPVVSLWRNGRRMMSPMKPLALGPLLIARSLTMRPSYLREQIGS